LSIVTALAANVTIAILKLILAMVTQSSSMISETIHSFADSGNQIMLLIGKKVSRGKSELFSFGQERLRFLFSFIVAVMLFFVGGAFSIMHSVEKFSDASHEIDYAGLRISIVVLLVSIALEGFSLMTAVKEKRRINRKQGILKFYRETKNSELLVILTEDFMACVGLSLALAGVILTMVTGNIIFDTIGGLSIGVLLICGAIVLGKEISSLIVGEKLSRKDEAKIKRLIKSNKKVKRLINFQSSYLGPSKVLLGIKIEDKNSIVPEKLINQLEEDIRALFADIQFVIYIELDTYSSKR
jgi:cation diffusion facilitator family transporter